MWPIRRHCMSLDHTTTSTCFLEPATSSGHLAPFHLGDESVIRSLTCILPHHCQHLPSPTATSSTSSIPGCQHHINDLHFCHRIIPNVPASTIYFRVPASISVLASTSESRVLITSSPHDFAYCVLAFLNPTMRPQLFSSLQHAIVSKKVNCSN